MLQSLGPLSAVGGAWSPSPARRELGRITAEEQWDLGVNGRKRRKGAGRVYVTVTSRETVEQATAQAQANSGHGSRARGERDAGVWECGGSRQ